MEVVGGGGLPFGGSTGTGPHPTMTTAPMAAAATRATRRMRSMVSNRLSGSDVKRNRENFEDHSRRSEAVRAR